MTTTKKWLLIGIIVLLTSVGLPLTKREATPVQAEPIKEEPEPIEMTVAKLFVSSKLKMNCYEFKVIWQGLFPEANCYRYKTNIGTYHWECRLNDKQIIDANWDLKGTIMIRNK